jgi:hypothetical protein
MRFRLADDDRERLGITQEWIEFDLDTFDVLEAEALEDGGYDAAQFIEQVLGYERTGPDGQPLMVAKLDDGGNEVLDADGQPELVKATRHYPVRARRALTWLAARRAGCTVPLQDFTYGILTVQVEAGPDKGKDPGSDEASEKSDSAT